MIVYIDKYRIVNIYNYKWNLICFKVYVFFYFDEVMDFMINKI